MKKSKFLILSFLIFILLTGCTNKKQTDSRKKTNNEIVPTLYFHGLGGNYKTGLPLAKLAKKKGKTNCVIRANVSQQGKVKLVGKITRKAKNPLILVNYKANMQPNFAMNGRYATNVVKKVQKKYHFKKMNMVGYSLGNISIIYYFLQNGQKKNLPRLAKQVNIAGHFDGANFKELPRGFREPKGLTLNSKGKPNKMNETYQEMEKVRPIYQKHPVRVLNIIGNIGKQNDGIVSNNSSLSLKYLIAGSPYKVAKFEGADANHMSLSSNKKVLQKVIQFLW